QRSPPQNASASVTAGLKWAPEMGPKVRIKATSAAPVASVFASSATATLPPARRSPMMPEPTTAASSIAVPTASATRRRSRPGRLTRCSRRAHAGQRRLRRQPRRDPGPDLVAYTLKHRQPLLVAARRSRGIVEAPVQPADPPREHRTGLVGVVAHGDDVVPSLAEKARTSSTYCRADRCRSPPSRAWRAG